MAFPFGVLQVSFNYTSWHSGHLNTTSKGGRRKKRPTEAHFKYKKARDKRSASFWKCNSSKKRLFMRCISSPLLGDMGRLQQNVAKLPSTTSVFSCRETTTPSFEDHAVLNTWLGKQGSIVLDLTGNIFLSLYFLLLPKYLTCGHCCRPIYILFLYKEMSNWFGLDNFN